MSIPTDDYLLGMKDAGKTQKQLAKRFDMTVGQVAGRITRYRNKLKEIGMKYPVAIDEFEESIEINADGTQTSDRLIRICEEDRKNPRRLLELHNYDPDKWVLVHATDNLWHMSKGWRLGGGNELLYQSKITAKPNTELSLEFVRKFFDTFEGGARAKPSKQKQYTNNGDILEINYADLHKGKRVPYDRHDLSKNIKYTTENIVNRCVGKKFSKVILVLNGDTFHFDGKARTTTGGTRLETDGATPFEIYDDVVSMLIWVIDSFSAIAPVEVIVIPGNHDWFVSYTLAMCLELYYKPDQNIIVDTTHKPRKWRIVGCALIGWAHGDMSKTNIASWLMVEAREAWGKTKFAEVHAAHWHSQQTVEKNGTVVRWLPSMTGTDEWHYDKGYVGSVQATVAFIWGKEEGLKETWHINVL